MGLHRSGTTGGMVACALAAALVMLVGCSGDDEEPKGDSDGAVVMGDGSVAPATGGSGGTAGTSTAGTSGTASGGTGGGGSGGGGGGTGGSMADVDAGADPTAGGSGGGSSGGSGGGSATAPPHDGMRLSICDNDDDCMGDDLVCYGANGGAPGFCTDDCATDDDCPEIEGIQLTCSTNSGACRVECGADGSDGACPGMLECRQGTERCGYADGAADGSVALWGACDNSNDCADGRICSAGSGNAGFGSNTYCTDECESEDDCVAADGASAVPSCSSNGACRLDCSADGATCPDGMECSGPPSARCLPSG